MILAPRRLLREPDEVRTGDVVVVPDLSPAHAAEIAFRVVRIDLARQAIGFLMIDPMQRVAGMQGIPRASFVGI